MDVNKVVKNFGLDVVQKIVDKAAVPVNTSSGKVISEIPSAYSDAISAVAKSQIVYPTKVHQKIPYLYHLTPVSNLQAIQKEGLKPLNIIDPVPGVYFFDKNNFINCWRKPISGDLSEADKLMVSYAFRDEDMALLRIPTAAFNAKKLNFRSYNDEFAKVASVHDMGQALKYADMGHVYEWIYNGTVSPNVIEKVGQFKPHVPDDLNLHGLSDGIVKILEK